jgi:hypothetical protein
MSDWVGHSIPETHAELFLQRNEKFSKLMIVLGVFICHKTGVLPWYPLALRRKTKQTRLLPRKSEPRRSMFEEALAWCET